MVSFRKIRINRKTGPGGLSDRSGFRFPMKEMVFEPGTNFLVHESESDGDYSLVSHPVNNPGRYQKFDDPKPVKNARPELDFAIEPENEDLSWLP